MNKKTLTAFIVAVAIIHGAVFPIITRAQEPPPAAAASSSGGSVAINNQAGRVQIKLERGGRVAISNRYGRITITGWDRDTVEATATSDKGAEAVQVEMTADPAAAYSVLSLTVPGRAGQRNGSMPFIYANPNININPRLYFPQSPTPRVAPVPPLPEAQGTTTPAPARKASPAKPAKTKPQGNNNDNDDNNDDNDDNDDNNNVIIVPMPLVIAPEVMAAPPRQTAPGAPKVPGRGGNSGNGSGGGIGGGSGGGFGGSMVGGEGGSSSSSGISLNVRMPRYAMLEAIEVRSGDVNISDIDGPVSISSGSSNISVNRVGALEVRARSGNINVDGVEGLVYIVATSGTISVRRTSGDVRATSINGDINLHCIKGRVDASNARGGIILSGVEGDVEASTTDADINFTGAIRPQGRYRLKSMEGRVIMAIPEASPGFTAIISSYNSDVVTTFPVATEVLTGGSTRVNRRIVVKQGNGDAQIMLDSFGQTVHLTKLATGALNACK